MYSENTPPQSSVQSLQLMEEIIEEEILSRLPVKSLLRFRCVSKSWRSLIDSKRFIKTHLQNCSENLTYEHWRVILHCNKHGLNQHGPNQSSLHSYTDEPFLEPSPIDDPENNHLMAGIVVGRCNGILCIYKKSGCFFFWNPAIRVSIELPKIDLKNLQIIKWGFGWDEESGAYKVFVGVSDHKQTIAQVYNSKKNSWKTVELGSLPLGIAFGNLACGNIHWLTKSGDHVYIESFDLKSEVFGMIELPCKPEVCNRLSLWEIEGCFTVLCDNINDRTKRRVWVMEEYGVKESWVEGISKTDEKGTRTRTHCNRCCRPIFYFESLVSPVLEKN